MNCPHPHHLLLDGEKCPLCTRRGPEGTRESEEARLRDAKKCPHCGDPLVDGRCVNALCDHATCPHGFKVWLFGTAEGCKACDAIEIVAGTRIGFFPRAAKPSNCPHCGEPMRETFTQFECPLRCDRALVKGRCPHCGEPPPLHRVSCEVLDRLRAAAADARDGVEANVLSCPHGIPLAAAQPCFVCLASTLLKGKHARELAHLLATCAHPNAQEERELYGFGVLCPDCGAMTMKEPGHRWQLPSFVEAAKALDADGASSGPAPDPSSADSEKKSDT